MKRARVLFIAEAVTLAHVARLYVLASALDRNSYDVHFAHHPRYDFLFDSFPFVAHEIYSIEPQQFMEALAGGKPLYDAQTLRKYVDEDLKLIEQVQPDIVVGDFRLSLSVSAVLSKVPYIALSNAYWSPYAVQNYTVPELPIVKMLGLPLAQWLFSLVRPIAFYLHTKPINKVRREYGLPALGGNLREIYTYANCTLYADIPTLFTTSHLPENHHFIGPILWSPDYELPLWWNAAQTKKPIVYVTLGSSGNPQLLPMIMSTLADLELTGIISTAGVEPPENPHENIFLAEYLPGDASVSIASLVICNGGSPTTHQALAEGRPVIGIASNLDQYLNMQAIETSGAGLLLRSDKLETLALRESILRVLSDEAHSKSAIKVAEQFRRYKSVGLFQDVLDSIIRRQGSVP